VNRLLARVLNRLFDDFLFPLCILIVFITFLPLFTTIVRDNSPLALSEVLLIDVPEVDKSLAELVISDRLTAVFHVFKVVEHLSLF